MSPSGDVGETASARRFAPLVALVIAAFLAARFLHWVPWWCGSAVVVACVALLRPKWMLVGVLLLIGTRAGGELDSLTPSSTRPLEAELVRLVDDPRPDGVSWRVQLDLDGQRILATARNPQAGALRNGSAGDVARVSGTLRGLSRPSSWTISNRLVGRLTVADLEMVRPAGGLTGAANAMRDTIRDGADSLSRDRRVLFTGLVFGDDRGQNVIVADNFRAAGLGHLLAVSGQNVVFILLLASPLLQRISSIPVRFLASSVVLVGFGFLTRFEPSVTRALVMAALVLAAFARGRPASAPAVLAPAVLGLLLIDPLLAWSLAFQLSVAATVGLVVITPLIVARLPGPDLLRFPVAATLAAQLAVSPLLFATFGYVSVTAVPANLLAAPAAAGVMMWGLVAGGIAGLGSPGVAVVLHSPTRLMIWWIDGVAATFARIEVGQLTTWHVLFGVAGFVLYRRGDLLRWLAVASLVGGVLVPTLTPRGLSSGHHVLVPGVEVHRSTERHDVVLLSSGARTASAIEALRRANLGRIDLLIALDGGRTTGRLVHTLHNRFEITDVWAPPGHQVPRGRTMSDADVRVGTLEITISNGDVHVEHGDPHDIDSRPPVQAGR